MSGIESGASPGSAGPDYTARLKRLSGARWKRVLDVQAPYRWHVRRLRLGRTLDVGCGLGRNLAHLGGNGVGVDYNATSVATCRERGLEAYTTQEFFAGGHAEPQAFDSMLVAHVIEHMSSHDARDVVAAYLPCLRPDGCVVFITPQERGYASDPTHVRWVGFAEAAQLCQELGLAVRRQYSFPFPRTFGKLFTYNEFVTVARKAAAS
ncbi:MAG TPA: class I SAM-dependent methyltransferase [Nocardioides sp.]|jgi:2-polyprenyl-3-methyl-5-hydroxy-6-metoxy-1,4-benzoquinol methylase